MIIGANTHFLVFFSFLSKKLTQYVNEIILKSTQADIKFADDGKSTWVPTFSIIAKGNVDETLNTLEKAYKRSKDKISKMIAQFFLVAPTDRVIPDVVDMLKTQDKSVCNEGLLVLDAAFKSQLSNQFFDAITNLLRSGGLDVEAKISIFRCFAHIEEKQQKHVDLLISILKGAETDEVKASVVDTLNQYFYSDGLALSSPILEALFACLSTRKGTVNEPDHMFKRIVVCIGNHASSLANNNDPIIKKVVDYLGAVIAGSEKKLADRLFAIYCTSSLLRLAEHVSLADKEATKLNIYQRALSGKASYLVTADNLQRLTNDQDFVVYASLFEQVLFNQKYFKNLALKTNESNDVLTTACKILVNTVSCNARQQLARAIKTNRSSAPAVVDMLYSNGFCSGVLKEAEEDYKQQKIESSKYISVEVEEEELSKPKHSYSTKTLIFAFLVLAPQLTEESKAADVAEVFIYCHHPLMLYQLSEKRTKKNVSELWDEYVKYRTQGFTDAWFQNNISAIVPILIDYLIISKNDLIREAAVYALTTATFMKQKETFNELLSPEEVAGQQILGALSDLLREHSNELIAVDDEDLAVFMVKDGTSYHDVESELANNPMFLKSKDDYESKKYSLTLAEWDDVMKKETDIHQKDLLKQQKAKVKSEPRSIQDIRKMLVSNIILEKENATRDRIQVNYLAVQWCLRAIDMIILRQAQYSNIQRGQAWHLIMSLVTDLFACPFSELSLQAKSIYQYVAQYQFSISHVFKHTTSSALTSSALARMLSDATYRLIAGKRDESRVLNDSDLKFGESVISKVRLSLQGHIVSATTFSCLLPFLQAVLNRKNVIGSKDRRFSSSSLSTAMSMLSIHAGLDSLTPRLREAVICVCVHEVLNYIPHLGKQASNALLSMAPFLSVTSKTDADIAAIVNGLTHSETENARNACLKTIEEYVRLHSEALAQVLTPDSLLVHATFYAQFDEAEQHIAIAEKVWSRIKSMLLTDDSKQLVVLSDKLRTYFYGLLGNESEYVKYTAAAALAGAIELLSVESGDQTSEQAAAVVDTISVLFDLYSKQSAKNEHICWGVSAALIECAPFFVDAVTHIDPAFNFIFEHGLNDSVASDEFVSAGLAIIDHRGKQNKEHLINLFENFLKISKGKSDYIVGSVVVFLGSVARYLSPTDERLAKVIDRLVHTLHVQSNTVQQSVCQALTPLTQIMSQSKANEGLISEILDKLLSGLRKGKTYGDRRGMAWGLAGAVRGLGVTYIYKVLKKLHIALHNAPKTEKKQREGVMLAYECLARTFGKLFEPFIVEVIPNIVFEGFSDNGKDVRDAANDAATHVMAFMTGHGVRMILPSTLDAVSRDNASNWRQKRANIQLLGHMAYCAPRQLSSNLPIVVRALTDNLSDAHSEVSEAARKALERVGSAVANPEITSQVPVIINALEDPEKFADVVLEALIHTRFTHSIDVASLALLIPILLRGLKERGIQLKRKSAQIIGSMSLLTTDPKDLMPYIPTVVPLLKNSLMDPNPQVRTASAKAIGSLCKSIGQDQMGDIVPWLHDTLKRTDNKLTTVERGGAAQALCEIIAAQGVSHLQEILPYLLSQISGQPAEDAEEADNKVEVHKNVREGYLQIFIYLPALMKTKFEQFLPVCLPVILNGLSDPAESVRDSALQSCKVIVELFTTSPTSLELLFPALRDGMENEEWRTRHASVMLMYEFLSRLAKANAESARSRKEEEEEEEGVADGGEEEMLSDVHINLGVLTQVLGKATMDHILAVLFMLQNDVHAVVKSQAVTLWRAMVVNTPRLLKSIVHTSLISLLISHLRRSEEQRLIAGRTMGELVMKLGDTVVSDLIPLLTEQLKSNDPEVRQGVCIGLKELLNSSNERQLQRFTNVLLPAVKLAVCDKDEEVQDAAAELFDVLFRVMGQKAVQEIVNQLLKDLSSNHEAQQQIGLSGLRQLIKVRAQHVLPKLVPSLIKKPITITQARTLASISNSLDDSNENHLQNQLTTIVTVYTEAIADAIKSEALFDANSIKYKEEGMTSSNLLTAMLLAIFSAVSTINTDNLFVFVDAMTELLGRNEAHVRRAALLVIQLYFESLASGEKDNMKIQQLLEDEEFLEEHSVALLEGILKSFNDPSEETVKTAWHACSSMMRVMTKDILPNYITPIREIIRSQTEDDQGNRIVDLLPGFNIVPNSLQPLLEVFLQGLRYGKTVEVKEQAAIGLGDIIELTSTESLAPFVRAITGPLILVVGDRLPWQVKSAILKSLSLMLEKGGNNLKPFLPPLQSAFIKALQDSNEAVRSKAAAALGKLVGMNPRIDGLITEILTTLKKNAFLKLSDKVSIQFDQQMAGVCIALLQALHNILSDSVVKTLKPTMLTSITQTIFALLEVRENTVVPQSVAILNGAFNQNSPTLEKIRSVGANCLVQCMKAMSQTELETVFANDIVSDDEEEDSLESRLAILSAMFTTEVSDNLSPEQIRDAIALIDDNISSRLNAARAAYSVLLAVLFVKKSWDSALKKPIATRVIEVLGFGLTDSSNSFIKAEIVGLMKNIAKRFRLEGIANVSPLFSWVPMLMQQKGNKYASERALFYILGSGDNLKRYTTSEFVKDDKEAKTVVDYSTKMFKRLSEEDSDDEEE